MGWTANSLKGLSPAELACEAARAFEDQHRQRGQANGPLGHIGYQIFKYFAGLPGAFDGYVVVRAEEIAKATRRSRSAITAAMARLKAAGVLDQKRAGLAQSYKLIVTSQLTAALQRMIEEEDE